MLKRVRAGRSFYVKLPDSRLPGEHGGNRWAKVLVVLLLLGGGAIGAAWFLGMPVGQALSKAVEFANSFTGTGQLDRSSAVSSSVPQSQTLLPAERVRLQQPDSIVRGQNAPEEKERAEEPRVGMEPQTATDPLIPAPAPPQTSPVTTGDSAQPNPGVPGLAATPSLQPQEPHDLVAEERIGLIGTSNAGEPVRSVESASAPQVEKAPEREQAVAADREQRVNEETSPAPPTDRDAQAVGGAATKIGQSAGGSIGFKAEPVAGELAPEVGSGLSEGPAPEAGLADQPEPAVEPKAAKPSAAPQRRPNKEAQAVVPPVVAKRTEPKPPQEARDREQDRFMRQVKITDYLREADRLYQQGDFKGAVRMLRRITTKYPNSEETPQVMQLIEKIKKSAGGLVE